MLFNRSPAEEQSETHHMTNSDVSGIVASLPSLEALGRVSLSRSAIGKKNKNKNPHRLSCLCRSSKVCVTTCSSRPLKEG